MYILFGQSENSFYRVFGIHFKGIQKVLSFAHIGGKMITEILNLIGVKPTNKWHNRQNLER